MKEAFDKAEEERKKYEMAAREAARKVPMPPHPLRNLLLSNLGVWCDVRQVGSRGWTRGPKAWMF